MVMVGHAQRLTQPLTGRQRLLLALTVAVLAGGVLWAVLRSGGAPASARGCVSVVVATSTGGGLLHECGAAARALCRSEATAAGSFAADVRTQCRLAAVRTRGD
jgi:hypothetical protein